MPGARFVGVGVGAYERGHPGLDRAVADVEAVAGVLAGAFECAVLADPDERAAEDLLKGIRGSMPDGGSLVVLWSGHGVPSDLPRVFRTADLWLIHTAACCSRYSSWTCCGVRYRSPECRRFELYQNSMYLTTSRRACSRVGYWVR